MQRYLAVALVIGATVAPGCAKRSAPEKSSEVTSVPTRPIDDVLRDHAPQLMQLPGVAGVYQGERPDGSPRIVVLLADSTRAATIPHSLEGYPVETEFSGPIRPLQH